MRRPLIAGNWKLHKTLAEAEAFGRQLVQDLSDDLLTEVMIAPPFTALATLREAIKGSPVRLGAQNCYPEPHGAFTGEVSAALVQDAGCDYVILGHSERRQLFHEDNELIRRKLLAALEAHLMPILCIGESLAEREAGRTEAVLARQLEEGMADFLPEQAERLTLAYEPIWAIGTGRTASAEMAQETHSFLRNWLEGRYGDIVAEKVRILYGGSVKPDNVDNLMGQPDIDGALVGGASLQTSDFLRLIHFSPR